MHSEPKCEIKTSAAPQGEEGEATGQIDDDEHPSPLLRKMAPIRLRHPKGVLTLQIALDNDDFTVGDLQQQIFSASDILPSRQLGHMYEAVKTGYPPRPLTLVPELPFSSLGIKSGDQIIVSESPSPIGGALLRTGSPSTVHVTAASRSPAGASSPSTIPINSSGPDFVEIDDGSVLVHRVVPDDNSCLFSAVALVFEQSISKAQELRKIVAEGIRKDPETYNEAILGMPPAQYVQIILKPATWGGAIELGVLANHYRTEIASVDVETGRIDYFSPGERGASNMRCILVYSGIHYDTASIAPMTGAPDEWHQTLFPMKSSDSSDPILLAAAKLADILRAKKAYTNTNTFDLKCEQCGKGLKGEKEARTHAEQTGHVRFGEY